MTIWLLGMQPHTSTMAGGLLNSRRCESCGVRYPRRRPHTMAVFDELKHQAAVRGLRPDTQAFDLWLQRRYENYTVPSGIVMTDAPR